MARLIAPALLFCMAGVLLAKGAMAATPEQEALTVFAKFCVASKGNAKAIDVLMKDVVKEKAGGKIPVAKLTAETGIKADNAWAIRAGTTRQQLLVTTYHGICALHLNSGDASAVKKEFLEMGQKLASASKEKLKLIEQKKQATDDFASYRVGDANITQVLAITTSDTVAASGTKHLLTYSPSVKIK